MIDVKNKTNYNDDDNSNFVNFNKNGEEVEEVEENIFDDIDNTTSDNNEDTKYDKVYNKVTPKMSVLSVVYEAHFFKTNMNVFKEILKNNKEIPLLIIKKMKFSQKINQFINHRNNIKHKTLVYV